MLFFFKVRVTPKELSLEQLWDIWEKETEAAQAAMSAGKILSLYKVAGQRFVLGVVDVESHEELDRIIMGALPMGSTPRNRDQAAAGRLGGESCLDGRPRRLGATQAGKGTW